MKELMAQSESSILYMRSSIHFYVRTYSRYYSQIAECSLDKLASYIDLSYNSMPEDFSELTAEKVLSIQNRIMNGIYSISPLQLYVSESINQLKAPSFNHIINVQIDKKMYYGYLTPIQDDQLVFMALGLMLNKRIQGLNLMKSFSFGLKANPTSYYAHISSIKGTISRVYHIDLSRSLRVIKKDCLLTKLEPIVNNNDIMRLLVSFLYIPIIHLGEEISLNDLIPTTGLLTYVLLNLYLIELDNQFHQLFPLFSYTRYVQELIVTTSKVDSSFEESLLEVLVRFNLAGKIRSIGPGDDPITCCYGGLVWLSVDGKIVLMV